MYILRFARQPVAIQTLFFVALAAVVAILVTSAGAADRSVLDGVFSVEQAARGAAAYTTNCWDCHGPDMAGDQFFVPQIGGTAFVVRWRSGSLADMYQFITAFMPYDNPGFLDPETYVAIMAYVLQFSGYPAGAADLPADAEALASISVEPLP